MKYRGAAILMVLAVAPTPAQWWDSAGKLGDLVSSETSGKLKLSFESRGRYESRLGQGFGKDPDLSTGLLRTRFGLTVRPADWLKISAMAQDSRAPWYGPNAPSSAREGLDFQEGYVELFSERKKGFGMQAGRAMLNYGEGRLLGSPQWGNLARTWDHGRVWYRLPKAQVELLVMSPVKVRIGEFNQPVLGDRIWGVYNSLPDLFHKTLVEVYVLRHQQNRPAGFAGGSRAAGTDSLSVNTYGFRAAGPAASGWKFSIESAWQGGHVGPARHSGNAWFSGMSRRWTPGRRTLDLTAEYKYASGSDNPADASRSGTFDQLYPANHDKFGHEDLFGWRNIHNVRSLLTFGLTKAWAANVMYDNSWLASRRDALYSGQGRAITRSADGSAGRHVGQEFDAFMTYKFKRFLIGAGYGYFLHGEYIRRTTPHVSPQYLYLTHGYSF